MVASWTPNSWRLTFTVIGLRTRAWTVGVASAEVGATARGLLLGVEDAEAQAVGKINATARAQVRAPRMTGEPRRPCFKRFIEHVLRRSRRPPSRPWQYLWTAFAFA
jgi:hypothetical protein